MEWDLNNDVQIEECLRHSDTVYNLVGRDYVMDQARDAGLRGDAGDPARAGDVDVGKVEILGDIVASASAATSARSSRWSGTSTTTSRSKSASATRTRSSVEVRDVDQARDAGLRGDAGDPARAGDVDVGKVERHLRVCGDLGQVVPMEWDLNNDVQIEECLRHSDMCVTLHVSSFVGGSVRAGSETDPASRRGSGRGTKPGRVFIGSGPGGR
jgi:hypothetical protein